MAEERFEQLVNGQMFIHKSGEHFSQVCCDCSSAHNIKVTVINAEEIEIQLYKNRALTKEARETSEHNVTLVSPEVYKSMMVLCTALANWPKKNKLPKGYRRDIRGVAKQLMEEQKCFEVAVKSGDFLS